MPRIAKGDSLTVTQRKKAEKIKDFNLAKAKPQVRDSVKKVNTKPGIKAGVKKTLDARKKNFFSRKAEETFLNSMGKKAGIKKKLSKQSEKELQKSFSNPKLQKVLADRTMTAFKREGGKSPGPIKKRVDKGLRDDARKLFKSTFEKQKAKENRKKGLIPKKKTRKK